jgi:hypothetical protein
MCLKVTTYGKIKDGKIDYPDSSLNTKLADFKGQNEGKVVEVCFTVADSPAHWQFRYLYGFVYPAIAEGMGIVMKANYSEHNSEATPGVYEVDKILKEKYLFQKAEDERDIPARYAKRCEKFYVDVIIEEGEVIRKLYGYIPSKTKLTYSEMKNFIMECEHERDSLDGWNVPESLIASMYRLRSLAMSDDPNQKGLFD